MGKNSFVADLILKNECTAFQVTHLQQYISVKIPYYIHLHFITNERFQFTVKASQVIFCSVLINLYCFKTYELSIFNTGKIHTEQTIELAPVNRATTLFIAINVSFKT